MGSKYSQASGLLPSELTSVYKNHQALPICETNESLKELLDNYAYPNPYECSVYSGTAPADGVKYYITDFGLAEGVLWHIKYFPGNGMGNSVMIAYPASAEYTTMMRVGTTDKWDEWVSTKSVIETDGTDITVSNPNLLDNPDFKINQRGLSEYTYTSNTGYAVDRWNIARLSSVTTPMGKMQLTENGVNLVSADSANDTYLRQFIANGEQLVGKNVTISLNVDEFTGEWAIGQYGKAAHALPPIDGNGTISITFEWVENDGYGIQLLNRTAGATLNGLKWIKLELGSVATPFVAPNPTEELLKIQSMNDDGSPKLVSDSTMSTIMNSAMVSNPNLLVNPDFKINQRGQSEYNTHNAFTVDCWKLWKYSANNVGTVTPVEDGIILTSSGESGSVQFSHPIENANYLIGRTVTVSFEIEEILGSWALQQHGTSNLIFFSSTGVHSLTFTWASGSIYGLNFTLPSTTTGEAYCKIKWIKLELGPVATPFVPPNPTIELLKCGTPDDTNVYGYMPTGIPSNPNLLDNPDFKINQRGLTEYTEEGYNIDRWALYNTITAASGTCTIKVTNNGIEIDNQTDVSIVFYQRIELADSIDDKQITVSGGVNGEIMKASGVAADNVRNEKTWGWLGYTTGADYKQAEFLVFSKQRITVEWVKLELGSVATPFVPPNPATELAKCQRYFEPIIVNANPYGTLPGSIITQGFFKVAKRVVPTLTVLSLNGVDKDVMGLADISSVKVPIRAYAYGSGFHLDYAGLSEDDTTACDIYGNVGCIVYANAEL